MGPMMPQGPTKAQLSEVARNLGIEIQLKEQLRDAITDKACAECDLLEQEIRDLTETGGREVLVSIKKRLAEATGARAAAEVGLIQAELAIKVAVKKQYQDALLSHGSAILKVPGFG